MTRLQTVAVTIIVAAAAVPARAQEECRPQTPAEQQAINRVLDTTRAVVEAPILAGDWQIERKRSGEKTTIANHPSPPRPLMVCQGLYNVEFALKPDSARGKPLYEKWKTAMNDASDPKAMHDAVHALNLTKFGIALGENPPYLREEIHSALERLTISGAALAYRVTTPPKSPGDDPVVHTYLNYGEWAAFPFDKDKYVLYPFAHQPGSPNIETLRINISGLPEVVDPIIKQIDWAKMAQALTK
jgi:hypothetical protein